MVSRGASAMANAPGPEPSDGASLEIVHDKPSSKPCTPSKAADVEDLALEKRSSSSVVRHIY